MSAAVAPSPPQEAAAGDSRKRRWTGEVEEASLPKRRYAEACRALSLDWVAHLCARYPGMSDKVRAATHA
jgi:hypothetical protein